MTATAALIGGGTVGWAICTWLAVTGTPVVVFDPNAEPRLGLAGSPMSGGIPRVAPGQLTLTQGGEDQATLMKCHKGPKREALS
jgi:3-hydroxyacyl-CoA dehydrogenase